MKILKLLTAVCLIAAATGCFSLTGTGSRTGMVPVYGVFGNWTEGGQALHDTVGTAEGEACSHSVFGMFTFGDGSIAAAMREGNIERVHTVDYNYFRVLGFYGKVCTRITGERTRKGRAKEPTLPMAPDAPEPPEPKLPTPEEAAATE